MLVNLYETAQHNIPKDISYLPLWEHDVLSGFIWLRLGNSEKILWTW
jgi:hypothetical protein